MNTLMSAAIVVAHPAGWDQTGPWGGEYWWIGRLVMMIVWIALIVLAIWWFRRSAWRREPSGIERARDILAERFARGELTADEYHERLGQLN